MRNGNSTKLQLAQNSCYWRLVLSKLQLNRKPFTLLLANSNFRVSAFWFVIFGVLFSIIHFSIYKFCTKIFKFCWQIPSFTLLLVRFQRFRFLLESFNFHASAFQFPTYQVSVGKFQLSRFFFVNFLRKQMFIFKSDLPA